jgi:hypothetical protein
MSDPDVREATASEELSLEEEYAMQGESYVIEATAARADSLGQVPGVSTRIVRMNLYHEELGANDDMQNSPSSSSPECRPPSLLPTRNSSRDTVYLKWSET